MSSIEPLHRSPPQSSRPPPALAVEGLCKTYASGLEALAGVSLEVEEGEFFALLGPNGAGKSTLIGIVCGLVEKSAGAIRVFGVDAAASPRAVRAMLGVVPQEVNFNVWESPLDIVVNQAGYYGIERPTALARAERYLGQLGLWDRRHSRARDLSGGMKRRLMIARALVHEPRLLILDEPTAGVDIELRRSTWRFLTEINASGTTIILTTHYLEEAESLCESIAIIDHGRIVEDSDMKSLLNKLHVETFVLDLATPLGSPPDISGYAVRRIDATTLEVDVERDQGVNRLFESLGRLGVSVLSMRNKTNRLEELFVRLVGEGRAQQGGRDAGPR
ncbi:MAG: ABC transporter ATP-binding protein [Ectothiorhodospiraceae bacterium]|nr:ABC transporter ATP-binding protein [Chromatiales bacterium]MCP5153265.1 ABC transporter ATP-binding protein [Ectothiorhodospiraceae bacterium]